MTVSSDIDKPHCHQCFCELEPDNFNLIEKMDGSSPTLILCSNCFAANRQEFLYPERPEWGGEA